MFGPRKYLVNASIDHKTFLSGCKEGRNFSYVDPGHECSISQSSSFTAQNKASYFAFAIDLQDSLCKPVY